MKGVEILNETQVVAESAFGWTAFWIAFSIIFGIFIIIGIVLSITEGPDLVGWILAIGAGIFLGLLFGFIWGIWCETPVSYETHYQVIIDDSVSMSDFLDKYEIIDTEGKILTIKERD
jgi:hypothetical protein